MSRSRSVPDVSPAHPDADQVRLNELLQQFRDAEDHDTPPGAVDGRDSRGRFAPGKAGGPGNPYNRRVAELRRIMLEEVSNDNLRCIIQVLLHKAQTGDLAAIKLVLQCVLGKPTPAPDPDAVERHQRQPEQQTPRQGTPETRSRKSEHPQRKRTEPRTSGSATRSPSDPDTTATDANGGNGESGTDANSEGAPPPPRADQITDDVSRPLRD
jgi:hypothetical protein